MEFHDTQVVSFTAHTNGDPTEVTHACFGPGGVLLHTTEYKLNDVGEAFLAMALSQIAVYGGIDGDTVVRSEDHGG